uniref:Uncharacterized protein n=1 Tax=Globodera rostochiensis TaxID=31243 RepID=A0A914H156_GLORO
MWKASFLIFNNPTITDHFSKNFWNTRDTISGSFGLHVNVINKSGLPVSFTMAIASMKCSCILLGPPVKKSSTFV